MLSSSTRSGSVTSRVDNACSTSLALRLLASFPGPPCRPRVPASATFWHTLSSFRLNFVTFQPSRAAASADDGIWAAPVCPRRRNGSARATMSSFWSGVNDTRPTVVSPVRRPPRIASVPVEVKAGESTRMSKS